MKRFTKAKFLALSLQKREKLSAERLHSLFLNPQAANELVEYNLFQEWQDRETLSSLDSETISNRYHKHLKNAGIHLKEDKFLPSIKTKDRACAMPNLGYHIFLDGLRSAHNVGSILRTVEAFRLGDVYFSENTPFIDQKKVRDASMGAWEWVTCKRAKLDELPKPWICLETAEGAVSLENAMIPPGSTVIVGNEEFGCSLQVVNAADKIVEIPLRGMKNSLNVANAFAILSYELSLKNFTSS